MSRKIITRCMMFIAVLLLLGLVWTPGAQADLCSTSATVRVLADHEPLVAGETVTYTAKVCAGSFNLDLGIITDSQLDGDLIFSEACSDAGCVTAIPATLAFQNCTNTAAGVTCSVIDTNTVLIDVNPALPVFIDDTNTFPLNCVQVADINLTAVTPVADPSGSFFSRVDSGPTEVLNLHPGCGDQRGGAQGSTDTDFPPICGDGIVGNTPGETCDPPGEPGPGPQPGICDVDCHFCGDGIPGNTAGEICDDGNGVNGDGCENDCTPTPICGDGIVGNTPGETCDPPGEPGPGPQPGICDVDCHFCGDGIPGNTAGEICDDGNGVSGDGCENDCTFSPTCGDGIVGNTPGETCDPPGLPGPGPQPGICDVDCHFCGDGIPGNTAGEICDDGNGVNGDGCENDCTPTPICGDGIVGNTPGETCDPPGEPGPGPQPGICDEECHYCGDGIPGNTAGEICDDGNGINGDGCDNECQPNEGLAICRTPGFYGTHGGGEKSKQNAPNVTQAIINAAPGSMLDVCGQIVDSTGPIPPLGLESAIQGLCVSVEGVYQRQLYRQLTAAALNCVLSGDPTCGVAPFDWGLCNDICMADEAIGVCSDNAAVSCTESNVSGCLDPITATCDDLVTINDCIDEVDCWNNGDLFLEASNCYNDTHGTGCNEPFCEAAVCGIDPFCCDVGWDGLCVAEAKNALIVGDACEGATQVAAVDCFNTGHGTGCEVPACEADVCGNDSFCCDTNWDSLCVGQAYAVCLDYIELDTTDLCVDNPDDCHARDFTESPVEALQLEKLGPASSSNMCKRASKDDCTIDSCP